MHAGRTVALMTYLLKIGVGEHVAILGPNGCGKSSADQGRCAGMLSRLSGPFIGPNIWRGTVECGGVALRCWELFPAILMATCTRVGHRTRYWLLSGFFSSVPGSGRTRKSRPVMIERANRAIALMEGFSSRAQRDTD